MSKTHRRNKNARFVYEEDDDTFISPKKRNRKQEKRITAALRSNNIDELVRYSEEDY